MERDKKSYETVVGKGEPFWGRAILRSPHGTRLSTDKEDNSRGAPIVAILALEKVKHTSVKVFDQDDYLNTYNMSRSCWEADLMINANVSIPSHWANSDRYLSD